MRLASCYFNVRRWSTMYRPETDTCICKTNQAQFEAMIDCKLPPFSLFQLSFFVANFSAQRTTSSWVFPNVMIGNNKMINRPVTSHLFYWACNGTPTRLERRQIQFWVLDAIGRGSRRSPSNHRSHLDWSARWFPAETHKHHPDKMAKRSPRWSELATWVK